MVSLFMLTNGKYYVMENPMKIGEYIKTTSPIQAKEFTYKEDNNGKKPQAHKAAKIGYLLDDIRDRHKKIKQCIRYVQVMEDAITYHYSIGKIKFELSKVTSGEYKGRTEYWKLALHILED